MTSHCAPSSRPPSALLSDGELGVGACSQAAAHARQVGQTYLRVGNLVEARKHLARAEQLLQIETPNVYDVPTTAARERAHKSRPPAQGPSPAPPSPRHAPGGSGGPGRLGTRNCRAASPGPLPPPPPPPRRLGLLSTWSHNSGLRSRRLQSARAHPGARRGEGDDTRQLCVSHAARPHPTT